MTPPAVAYGRFLTGLALGCALGIFYGFLRPVRRGRAVLADIAFALFAGWVYLYYGFAVCRGDLRMGYFAAPLLGAIGWDRTFGRWLAPVWAWIWTAFFGFFRPVEKFLKKFFNYGKFLFASGKKWVTIKNRNRKRKTTAKKGASYARKEKSVQPHSAGIPPQYHAG